MATMRIAIMDQVLAAWQPITNTFAASAWPGGTEEHKTHRLKKFWNGILIQLGTYESKNEAIVPVKSILFCRNGDPVASLSAQEAFEDLVPNEEDKTYSMPPDCNWAWINVVPRWNKKPDRGQPPVPKKDRPPMEIGDLDSLRITGSTVQTLDRTLHPYAGGITIWQDEEYTVHASSKGKDYYNHNKYTLAFDSNLGFDVAVYLKGEPWKVEELASGVDTIVVTGAEAVTCQSEAPDHPGEGDPKGPPQKP